MCRLIVESGATKTDWLCGDMHVRTKGINLAVMSDNDIRTVVEDAVDALTGAGQAGDVEELFFYGAGIVSEKSSERLRAVFSEYFPDAGMEFASDLMAAARALWADRPGVVAILGSVPELRPMVGKKRLSMTLVIQMFMLLAGILMVMFCGAKAINKTNVFNAGMVAIVSVYGVAWMSDTMFSNHLPDLKAALTGWMQSAPWTFGIVLLLVSKLVNSQAAAVAIVVPVAIGIGTPPGVIVAMASAAYGYYILPTYPSDLAALTFDRSGTTHIGKFVINHSFILPGLIGVITAVIVGWCLGMAYGYI